MYFSHSLNCLILRVVNDWTKARIHTNVVTLPVLLWFDLESVRKSCHAWTWNASLLSWQRDLAARETPEVNVPVISGPALLAQPWPNSFRWIQTFFDLYACFYVNGLGEAEVVLPNISLCSPPVIPTPTSPCFHQHANSFSCWWNPPPVSSIPFCGGVDWKKGGYRHSMM